MKNRAFQLGMSCLVFLLGSAVQVKANIFLLVDDHQLDPIAVHILGPVLNSNIQVTQEGIGVLGAADAKFDYLSSAPLAVGETVTYSYNIYAPFSTTLADTWNITVTGIASDNGGANMNVDSTFSSMSLDGVSPTALIGGVSIVEDQTLGEPSGLPDGTYQYVNSPLSDLTTGFNSAPEPGFLPLVGVGVAGIAAFRFRRRKQSPAGKA